MDVWATYLEVKQKRSELVIGKQINMNPTL